jgi:hypothetical protein
MNLPSRHHLSICFYDSPRSRPVGINHTLTPLSRLVAAVVKPQSRRPQSPLALRNMRP